MAKIMFIQKEIVPIGIEYIASTLKQAGHKTCLVYFEDPYSNNSFSFFDSTRLFERFKQFLVGAIEAQRPDVIGFSTFTMGYHWAIEVARFVKQRFAIPTIFGGYHPTMVPEEVIKEPAVDMICLGEGEHAVLGLMNAIETKTAFDSVPNLWFKRDDAIVKNPLAPLITDLDALPFPNKEISHHSTGDSYLLMGSRGCPYRCTYCANNVYASLYPKWGKVRFRSVPNVLAEVEAYLTRHPGRIKRIEIMDDVVTLNNARLRDLCCGIKERTGLPYSCFLHPNLVDEESIRILKDTGCYWLKIGVQSASEENRREHLLRPETQEQIKAVARWCHLHGLYFSFDHIFSLPCDSEQDLIHSVEFYNETRPNIINYGSLVYLPKTKIVEDALAKGILSQADVASINRGEHVTATASNVGRLQGIGEHNQQMQVLIGRIAYLYSLISFRSQKTVARLLQRGFLANPRPLSLIRIIAAKFVAKFAARQFFIYWSVIARLLTAPFRQKYLLVGDAKSIASNKVP